MSLSAGTSAAPPPALISARFGLTPRWAKYPLVFLILAALAAVALPLSSTDVQAQLVPNGAPALGTCADRGMSVVEPADVVWASTETPVLDPALPWAYGDVDVLWDDAVDEYWFHWYDAVPGVDAYVEYQFAAGTVIQGVQFTHDWSEGDLELTGQGPNGAAVASLQSVPLAAAFQSNVASLSSMTVSTVKMTTSTSQVKLLEVDFCGSQPGGPGGPTGPTGHDLALQATSPQCETIAATWTPQPGADHITRVAIDQTYEQVDWVRGLDGSYGPAAVDPGNYIVRVTAELNGVTTVQRSRATVADCDGPPIGECVDAADAYCESENVIDSFGDAPLPAGADSTGPWNNVRSYYAQYGDRDGMCSIEIHNSYWTAVRDSNGSLAYYPSWHPPIHDLDGPQECRFTHEHGLDPRTSDLYDEDHPTNVGVPFGFVHPGTGGGGPGVQRTEDHVGHKVIVENDFQLTTNNPYGLGTPLNIFLPDGVTPVTCSWYSKLHQGTHSPDALGFNLHEYFLNYSCDDGTEVRIKEMTDFGFRLPSDPDVATPPNFPLNGGSGVSSSDCGWFATNVPAPAMDPDPHPDSDFGDAGRGGSCLMNDAKIEELWKPSAKIGAPDGAASLDYDPYYVVMNPNRFSLFGWWDYLDQDGDHVGDTSLISMVDFCVQGTELRDELTRDEAPDNFVKRGHNFGGEFRVGTYCDSIEQSVLDQWAQDIQDAGGDNEDLMIERKESVDNPFIGTRRGVHVKGPRVYGGQPNFEDLAFFCTSHLGNDTTWPINPDTGIQVTTSNPWSENDALPTCASGVAQILSTFNNEHNSVEGSTAGSVNMVGGGPGNEIIIDMDELYPNHGVQAPN